MHDVLARILLRRYSRHFVPGKMEVCMRYFKKDIVFQEVPGEISLCYFISGCPLRCKGCHSWFTWNEATGTALETTAYLQDLQQYKGAISCVLFMGGEWHESDLLAFLTIARQMGLKTCLYTGLLNVSESLRQQLTYLKTGPWVQGKGGLDNPATNQRMTLVETGACINHTFYKQPLAV
jgi:anaerobic ribonucleoside-triphosphate reductase activating protein